MRWLIATLEFTGHPSKIERLQHAGLAPRPVFHRHESLNGAELWPEGAVEHYRAVLPLIRQRHDAQELAALTMLGWGYPIEIGCLRRSYAKAYGVGRDLGVRAEALLDFYNNRGSPLFKTAMAHIRSHGLSEPGESAEELAYRMIAGALHFGKGNATPQQLRLLLAANAPGYGTAPEDLINWILEFYGVLQRETSLTKLLETVNQTTTEELLKVQPEVLKDMETSFAGFGGLEVACRGCDETKGLMVAASLPFYVRLGQLDPEEMFAMISPPPASAFG